MTAKPEPCSQIVRLFYFGEASRCYGLTYTSGVFVGDVELYLLRKLGELFVKNLLRSLKKDNTTLSRGNSTHYEHMLYIIELCIECNCIAKVCTDCIVDCYRSFVAILHQALNNL